MNKENLFIIKKGNDYLLMEFLEDDCPGEEWIIVAKYVGEFGSRAEAQKHIDSLPD